MPTFMTQPTFAVLTDVWRQLVAGGVASSYVFVPWAGEQLVATGRGIYYVGIATNAEEADGEPSFEASLRATESFCYHPTLGNTPFWRFLDRLSRSILNDTYSQTQQRWGWSNLLKVAGTSGPPDHWPDALIDRQRVACIVALQEEIARLRNSLIVIMSVKDYGILYNAVAEEARWDKTPRKSKTCVFHDPVTGNTFVRCYHPKYMAQKAFFEATVTDVVQLARETLRPFN